VDEADCGILLDLHNLYCNARNGRIRLDDYLAEIPLDLVWEVHLAGGAERDGFWLDSHSGPMPDDLAALARDVLSGLRELGALNFEIYDTYLARTAQEDLDRIVDELHALWEGAGRARGDAVPRAARRHESGPAPDPDAWEAALTEAVWRAAPGLHPWPEDEAALRLYAWLARSFRGSMLARTLPRAVRYLLLRDRAAVDATFEAYFAAVPPQLYGPLEAEAFAKWLAPSSAQDRLFQALIDYDLAVLRVVQTGVGQVVAFPGDPMPVFEALAEGRLPTCPEPPVWELEILPDGLSVADFGGSAAAS
jgi:hypothetical protein